MYKRRKNKTLLRYFNRLIQENKDHILCLMNQLFRNQYQFQESDPTYEDSNIIYLFKD